MKGAFAAVDAPSSGSRYSAFGTFLDTLRPSGTPRAVASQRGVTLTGSSREDDSNEVTRHVLGYLAEQGPHPASRIMNALDIGILEMAKVLPALVETGLVEVTRTGAGDVLRLTDLGTRIGSLITPTR